MATYMKAIKVTVDGPREPRSKTSKLLTSSITAGELLVNKREERTDREPKNSNLEVPRNFLVADQRSKLTFQSVVCLFARETFPNEELSKGPLCFSH